MIDLTNGNPAKKMLKFAVPVCLGNIFQLFYSLADTRIVGSILGEKSLAAVGSTTSISTLLIGFLLGLTNGFAIIIAQKFGEKNENEIKNIEIVKEMKEIEKKLDIKKDLLENMKAKRAYSEEEIEKIFKK